MSNKQILIPYDELPPDIQHYIQTRIDGIIAQFRTENTRECAQNIIDILEKAKREDPPGWVQSSKIFNALSEYNTATVSRMLKALSDPEKIEIIERRSEKRPKNKPGKELVYYRIPENFDIKNIHKLQTREELIESLDSLNDILNHFINRYKVAKTMLRGCGIEDPDAVIDDRIAKLLSDIFTELQKSDEELAREAKERMKDADLGPGEMLEPED